MPAEPASPATSEGPSTGGPALAFVVDSEPSVRQFISLILQGNSIDTMEFADGASLRRARTARPPDVVFLNVNVEVQDAIQTVEALGKAGFSGAIQLISGRGATVLDAVKQVGDKLRLRMLPPLKKPFETSVIQKVIFDLNLSPHSSVEAKVDLTEALKRNWIEFWYQPKIDLRKKQLAGAEAFARVNHPQNGILPPSSFMASADDTGLLALAEQALVSALKSGLNLSRLGVNLRMAVNVSVGALAKLPVADIVQTHRPQAGGWPGIVVDIAEEQIVGDVALAIELAKKLSEHNIRLAIDDFGKNPAAFSQLKEMPFAEMKLDRTLVVGCGIDKSIAQLCKSAIDLAHGFGSLAVGVGLETASDTTALIDMGCDLGQGFLFGQPMPEERFIGLLKQRTIVRADATPARAPATTDALKKSA